MQAMKSIETKISRWLRFLPDLPQGGKRWLGRNLWWLVLIFAALGAIGVLQGLSQYLAELSRGQHANIYLETVVNISPIVLLVSLIASIVSTALYFIALSPLYHRRKLGWNLVFYSLLIGIVTSIVTLILSLVTPTGFIALLGIIIGFVFGLVFEIAWLYFLFQARPEFSSRAASAVEAEVVTKKKTAKKK